jgi:hypothetical protein
VLLRLLLLLLLLLLPLLRKLSTLCAFIAQQVALST